MSEKIFEKKFVKKVEFHPHFFASLQVITQTTNRMYKNNTFVEQHIFTQVLSLSSKNSLVPVFKYSNANKWYKSIRA